MSKKSKIVVAIERETGGRFVSHVRTHPRKLGEAVVIDRQGQGHMQLDTLRARAQALATLMRVPLIEDPTYPCSAWLKSGNCMCPKCVGAFGGIK